MKRILLYLLTNMAVLAVLSIALRLLGIDQYMASSGQDLGGLLVFAALLGFGGSLISLAMSKFIAKRSTGARVITQPANEEERWLVATVQRLSTQAGIGMPDVAIFDSQDMNAFATGARRDSALVAVSRGLLNGMEKNEVEAVLGHEISHVANGDMVTMTLLQGVLNTFVIFFARIIGRFVDQVIFKSNRGQGPGFFIIVLVAQLLLGVAASVVVAWFSRQREFRADAGSGKLNGRQNMIRALERLEQGHDPAPLPDSLRALGIAGPASRFGRLFLTHPPLAERIAALRNNP